MTSATDNISFVLHQSPRDASLHWSVWKDKVMAMDNGDISPLPVNATWLRHSTPVSAIHRMNVSSSALADSISSVSSTCSGQSTTPLSSMTADDRQCPWPQPLSSRVTPSKSSAFKDWHGVDDRCPKVCRNVGEDTSDMRSEQQSDIDFLLPLQRVTSRNDVINADGDSTWLKLVAAPIATDQPTPMSSSGRRRRPRRHVDPYPPTSAVENLSGSRPARRTLFGRRAGVATPLGDIGNTPGPVYRRCVSDSAAIDCQRSPATTTARAAEGLSRALSMPPADHDDDDQRLVGDFTRPVCLPVVNDAKHCDLNAISHHTMAMLLRGEYSDVVESYTVVDCRYPYEYDGGHIVGAKNLYSREAVLTEFFGCNASETYTATEPEHEPDSKRRIIVFHCEFSSERAPKMLRYLRNNDRELHRDSYPALRHPELYLLQGGYREFHAAGHSGLCQPDGYRPMSDRRYAAEQARYRAESLVCPSDVCGAAGRRRRPLPSPAAGVRARALLI